MSNFSNSEINCSSIERKVLKNTLLPNSNFLRNRERSQSHISLFSQNSRAFSPISHNSFDSLISKNSVLGMSLLNTSLKEINLSMVFDDSEKLSSQLQDFINNSQSGTKIVLPGTNIVINSLILTESLTIKGTPGTNLIVRNGKILLGPNLHQKTVNVYLTELSIIFENSPTNNTMICIENPRALLEISDCVIKCAGIPNENVCIVMNPVNKSIEFANFNSKLVINSCNFANFSEFITANEGSSVELNKCHLTNASGNGLFMSNPKSLKISYCMIDKCKKNGIEIIIPNESISHSSYHTKPSSGRNFVRDILIERTDILNNNECGLILQSENLNEFNCNMLFDSNKFAHNKKEGIAVKHIVLNELKIINNDFNCNSYSGIWLQKVNRISPCSTIFIGFNRSFDSLTGYGIMLYSCIATLENNEIFRNSLGGVLIAGSCTTCIYDMTVPLLITSCVIKDNGEHGIYVNEFSNTIVIELCKINDNSKNGIFFANPLTHEKNQKNFVKAQNCEISGNCEFGITAVGYKCFFQNLALIENKSGEIVLGENTKNSAEIEENEKSDDSGFVVVKKSNACRGSCVIT